MAEQPNVPSQTPDSGASRSTVRRLARFVVGHPVGSAQCVFFALVGIIALQNLESTSIDVLFWSVPGFPKLGLMLLSMLVGAAVWELIRRLRRR